MKIYILPVPGLVQPENQPFLFPKHNSDYGLEQDFLKYLYNNEKILTDNPQQADWHYLPVFWTRWHLNNNYGDEAGTKELESLLDGVILNDEKTFTVCQYSDGPKLNIGKTTVYLGSRRDLVGRDLPLLCAHHKRPFFPPRKKYLSSFAGRIQTHEIRREMVEIVKAIPSVKISTDELCTSDYVNLLLRSYVSLSPRGYGGDSFRFYESMQLGVAPILIGDIDVRPFKSQINWDAISIYVKEPIDLLEYLVPKNKNLFIKMGQLARREYYSKLDFQKWCPLLINDLSNGIT